MAIVINGSGTLSGLAVGGLPDGTVDAGTLATDSVVTGKIADGTIANADIADLAASKLTGALPAISGASLTGLASPAVTKVTMAYNSSTRSAFGYSRDLFARNNEMVGHKVAFNFYKDSATTDIMVVFCMQVAAMRDCYQLATYSGTNYSSTFFKRFAFSPSISIDDNEVTTGVTLTGTAIYTAAELDSTGTKSFYWAMGRPNDGYNSSYILNPNTTEDAMYGGTTTSTITVYEGDFT